MNGRSGRPDGGIAQPGFGSLNLSALAVASKSATILSRFAHPIRFVRDDQFDAPLLQACALRVAVIGLVSYQPLRLLPCAALPVRVGDAA